VPLVSLGIVVAITWEQEKVGRRAPHRVCFVC
jgi:hypothetical protein